MSSKTKVPTEQEINKALDVFIRAAATGKTINPDVFRLAEQQIEEKVKQETPKQKEIERAMKVLRESDLKDYPPTPPSVKRMMKQWEKERAKHKTLAAQFTELDTPAFREILDALPESHKALFQHYGSIVVAPYAIRDEQSYRFFQYVYLDSKKILAKLESTAKPRSPKTKAKGGKNV